MYTRLYPKKCNTLFKNLNGYKDGKDGNVNTSQNPVLELRDGASKSILLFNFDITDIFDKLEKFGFQSTLNLFDGGLFYEPGIKLKYIDIFYFNHEWTEGDGFSFEEGKAKVGVSNYNYYDSTNLWTNEFTDNAELRVYHLQTQHEDLKINVKNFIDYSITNNINKFTLGIKITDEVRATASIKLTGGTIGNIITKIEVNNIDILDGVDISFSNILSSTNDIISAINNGSSGFEAEVDLLDPELIIITAPVNSGSFYNDKSFLISLSSGATITYSITSFVNGITGHEDSTQIYTKYINSHLTRTVFKPFLELIVVDEIKDLRSNSYPGDILKLYFQTNSGREIGVGTYECKIYDENLTLLSTLNTISYEGDGLYLVEWTVPSNVIGGVYIESWEYNSAEIFRNIIKIKSLIEPSTSNPYFNNLFFGVSGIPSTIHLNDIVKANFFAEIKHLNSLVDTGFQYRIIQSNGFEMVPWSDTNILNNEMFFYIDTSYFFPDIEYIILTRYNKGNISITSDLKTKFKIIDKDRNKLDSFNSSPYNSRNYYLGNNGK